MTAPVPVCTTRKRGRHRRLGAAALWWAFLAIDLVIVVAFAFPNSHSREVSP
jgi:hypothetical protein